MKVIRHLGGEFRPSGAVVTLGNFDGVHVGHQAVLARLAVHARRDALPSVAITFHPHPASVLAPERAPLALTTLGQRLERLAAAGLDAVVLQRFSLALARVDARSFAREVLVERLGARTVVIGHSTRFGRGREGNAERLRELGEEFGFSVDVVAPVDVDGRAVSSSAIRGAIAAGDLETGARMLGRPHSICGRVVRGQRRGATLGIPTANLRPRGLQLPPDGVYAVRARLADTWWNAAANVGFNPTFGGRERTLEAHLLDFAGGDLYGKRLEIAFIERLRGEIRFPDPEVLVRQIREDIEAARRLLQRR